MHFLTFYIFSQKPLDNHVLIMYISIVNQKEYNHEKDNHPHHLHLGDRPVR